MGLHIGKYRFNSKEQAESKIEGLGVAQDENGNNYPTHKHTITKLGYEVLEEAVYDGEEVISETVFGEGYLVDVLWRDLQQDENGLVSHPNGWESHVVDIDNEGIHGFLGLKYQDLKI
jgi:hypothetical protein